MPWNLNRFYGEGDLHFITSTCYRRLALLASAHARNVFVKILGEVRDAYRFLVVGYVVMPDHFHLLISEPAKGTPSSVMQVLKQRVSRQLRAEPQRPPAMHLAKVFSQRSPSLPQFWQRRFHDFNVWS